jgi:hypothetical protein
MSSKTKPLPERPDPALIEPGQTTQDLAHLLKGLEDARLWSHFAPHSAGGMATADMVSERLGAVDTMLEALVRIVSGLAHEVRVSEVQARNGITYLEASQLVSAEKAWLDAEEREKPQDARTHLRAPSLSLR